MRFDKVCLLHLDGLYNWFSERLYHPESCHVMHIHTVPSSDDLLHKQMQNWWRTDSFGTKYEQASSRSTQEKKALKHLKETVKNVGNRYQVGRYAVEET